MAREKIAGEEAEKEEEMKGNEGKKDARHRKNDIEM